MTNQPSKVPPHEHVTTGSFATPPAKPAPPTNDMHAFVASRDRAYDDAWLKTAEVLRMLGVERSAIWQTPYSFAWQMILNKLVRAMASPEHEDHWKDIQGYAQLVREELAKAK